METERNANLKKITPTIKRALKEKGFSENLISNWTPPSSKDAWGNRESTSYELDLAYAYADIPKPKSQKDAPPVLVFAKNYSAAPNASNDLEKAFLSSFARCNSQDEHFKILEQDFLDYDVEPLYIYRHSGEHFESSPSCRWDSALTGAVAIKKDSRGYSLDSVISELNSWLNGDEPVQDNEVGIKGILAESKEIDDSPSPTRAL